MTFEGKGCRRQGVNPASTMMVIFFVNRYHLVSVDTLGLREAEGRGTGGLLCYFKGIMGFVYIYTLI